MFRLLFDLIRTVFFLITMAVVFVAGGIVFNLDRLGFGQSAWKQYEKFLPKEASRLLPEKVAGLLPRLPKEKPVQPAALPVSGKPAEMTAASVSAAAPKPKMTLSGKVVAVLDGDTVVLVSEGRKFRVRLYGIDAPESVQEYGAESGRKLRSLVQGKTVTLDVMDIDSYGRAVSRVRMGDFDVNQEMVRNGAAWYYRHFAPEDTGLAGAQAEAQREKRGLWHAPNPMPPWEFRKRKQ